MTTARTEFLSGVRAELPILLGVAPFGMIYGALAIGAGLPRGASQAMSSIVFAGSLQFVATQLFATGAPGVVLLLTTFIVNLRHMLYSASLAPYLHKLPARWKWLLAYLLTDEAYAPTILHYRQAEMNHGDTEGTEVPDRRHWFLLGAGLALWSVWQVSTAVGIFLGAQVPPSWALDFTLALTFIALLVPALTDRPSVAAALSAGIIALVGAGWPYKLGLVTAALVGIAVGAWLDRGHSQSSEQEQIPLSAKEV
jgi:4-azaleucine resistance transporter AzlC